MTTLLDYKYPRDFGRVYIHSHGFSSTNYGDGRIFKARLEESLEGWMAVSVGSYCILLGAEWGSQGREVTEVSPPKQCLALYI